MSLLFSPLALRGLELPNRIQISPMCQYSAHDGCLDDWHLMHLGTLALSGAGLLVIEATHVSREGRITHGCSGLYDDANERALDRVLRFVRAHSSMPIGLQLGHAGRKASSARPWQGRAALGPAEDPWSTLAPSALPFGEGWPVPREASAAELVAVREAFVESTRRAARLGLDLIEVHAAHGYLLSTFLSPLANQRSDGYGGSRESRMRFPLEVFAAMRTAWPSERPMGVRIHGADWVDGGWDVDDAIAFAGALRELGCDYVTVSSGGVSPRARIPVQPGYQVPLASAVRKATGLPTCAVGMIVRPAQAEEILCAGHADQVALARALLFNPRWPWQAALELGERLPSVPQYERASEALWPGAALLRG